MLPHSPLVGSKGASDSSGAVGDIPNTSAPSIDFSLQISGPTGQVKELKTIQGKPRIRVYLACLQCRKRKIRCDGAKPHCRSCSKSSNSGGTECLYDEVPKRRGPDKNPGTRQRTVKKRRVSSNPGPDELDEGSFLGKDEVITGPSSEDNRSTFDGDRLQLLPDPCLLSNHSHDIISPPTFPRSPTHTLSTRPQLGPSSAPEKQEENDGFALDLSLNTDRLYTFEDKGLYPNVFDGKSDANSLIYAPLTLTRYPRKEFECSHDTLEPLHSITYKNTYETEPLIDGYMAAGSSSKGRVRTALKPLQVGYYATGVTDLGYGLPMKRKLSPDEPHETEYPWIGTSSKPCRVMELPMNFGAQDRWDISGRRVLQNDTRIIPEPALIFSRETWWDSLLNLYCPNRADSVKQISMDLKSLFEESQQFLSFMNVPLFYERFYHQPSRDAMQPSLVLAALALSNFIRSSEVEMGAAGRNHSMWLRDTAQSYLEASMNAGVIDLDLAMAAWLIAFFEISAHPRHMFARITSAMFLLESILRYLGYNALDIHDPRTSRFCPRTVPSVPASQPRPPPSRPKSCICPLKSLGHLCPMSQTLTPLWTTTPGWDPDWTSTEVEKEQARRLVWNSMMIVVGLESDAAAFGKEPNNFFLSDPSNYALLFPGENLLDPSVAKESVWALYPRCLLVWSSCFLMRSAREVSDHDKASFATQIWMESIKIEEALNNHSCMTERATMFHGREYLFNARMCISWEFRRYIPCPESGVNLIFHRAKAQEWLSHQLDVAHRLMQGLNTITGLKPNMLAKRPFFVWWFMSQVSRSLTLWSCEKSLLIALDVCIAFLPPINYLTRLWPCPAQRIKFELLKNRIADAHVEAGKPLPPHLDGL